MNKWPLKYSEIDHKKVIEIALIPGDREINGKIAIVIAGNMARIAGSPMTTKGIRNANFSPSIKNAFAIQWIPNR